MSDRYVNVLTMIKGDEHYVYLYGDGDDQVRDLCRELGRQAAHPELSLSWYDCAILARKAREMAARVGEAPAEPAVVPRNRFIG